MSKNNEKLHFLRLVRDSKHILFGAFSDHLTRDMKLAEWKKITSNCQSMGIVGAQKDYTYVRNIFWSNIKRATLSKRDNSSTTGAAGGKHQKLTPVDELVLEIIGHDSPVLDGIGVSDAFVVDEVEENINQYSGDGTTEIRASHTKGVASPVTLELTPIVEAITPRRETPENIQILSYKELSAQKSINMCILTAASKTKDTYEIL